jgi:hypothetical protein
MAEHLPSKVWPRGILSAQRVYNVPSRPPYAANTQGEIITAVRPIKS